MMMGFDKVKAETVENNNYKSITEWLWERGSVENNPYANHGTPNGIGFSENFAEAVELWRSIGSTIVKIIEWFNNFNENIAHFSVDLLAGIYKNLSMLVLHTPTILFSNSWFSDSVFTFTSISIAMFTITFILQVLKKTVSAKEFNPSVKYTETKDVIKKYAMAVVGIGFTPFLFEKGFGLLNTCAKFITSLGYYEISSNEFSDINSSLVDSIALLGFDLVLIGALVPIFLQNGRRWFDLICLAGISPLALSAWCFEDTKHLTSMWWKSIKDIGMVQIIYSFFIAMMGIFMFGTRGYTSGFGLIVKVAVIAGSLTRLANPPQFLLRMTDSNNTSVIDMYKNLTKTLGMANLTKYKPVNFAKNMIWDGMNAGKMREAKLEMGQRYIADTPTEARKIVEASKVQKERSKTGKRFNK